MEGSYLFLDRWVHNIIYGFTHRGLSYSGLRANHGRFEGLLTRLPPSVHAMIERWRGRGVLHLLRDTGIPPHLVQVAVERGTPSTRTPCPTTRIPKEVATFITSSKPAKSTAYQIVIVR